MAAASSALALALPQWLPLSSGGGVLSALSGDDALLAADWLLDGDEAASAQRWADEQAAPPLPAPSPAEVLGPQPLDDAPWRCLDPTHAASCASCVPAPPPADAGRYRLTDAAGQLAEKRLRALLSRCPEWSDSGARSRLAAALQAEEAASSLCSGAVEVLRSHSSARMRKHAMLRLAFAWRYRSDCWSLRGGGGGKRKSASRAAPVAGATAATAGAVGGHDGAAAPLAKWLAPSCAAQLALTDRTLTVAQAAEAQVLSMLGPHITAAARSWTGPHSEVEYGRVRGAGMTHLRVRSIEGAHEVCVWIRDVVAHRLLGLRAWRTTLDADTLRAPAYLCDAAFAVPESELEAIRHVLTQGRAATEDAAERVRQAHGGVLLPQHAAWLHDYHQGHAAVLALVAKAQAYCGSQRTQSLRAFLEAAEAILHGLVGYTRLTVDALQQRLQWTSEFAEAQGAAAGCRREAQAMLPPLVQRLRLTGSDPDGARLLSLASQPPPLGAPLPRFIFAAIAGGGERNVRYAATL